MSLRFKINDRDFNSKLIPKPPASAGQALLLKKRRGSLKSLSFQERDLG
jgi:hypothetical protein